MLVYCSVYSCQSIDACPEPCHVVGQINVNSSWSPPCSPSCPLHKHRNMPHVFCALQSPSGYGRQPGTFDGEVLLELTYKPFEEDEQDSGYREAEAFQRTLQQLTNAQEERITDVRSAAAASSRAAVAASAAISAIAMTKAAAARAAARAAKAAQQAAAAAAEQAAVIAHLPSPSMPAPGSDDKADRSKGRDDDSANGSGSGGKKGSDVGAAQSQGAAGAGAAGKAKLSKSTATSSSRNENGNGNGKQVVEADVVIPPLGPGSGLEHAAEQQLLDSLNERSTPEKMAQALFAAQRAASAAAAAVDGISELPMAASQAPVATAAAPPKQALATATSQPASTSAAPAESSSWEQAAATNGTHTGIPVGPSGSNGAGPTSEPEPPSAVDHESLDWLDYGGMAAVPPVMFEGEGRTDLQGAIHAIGLQEEQASKGHSDAPSSSSSQDAASPPTGSSDTDAGHLPLPLVLNRVHDLGYAAVGSMFGRGKKDSSEIASKKDGQGSAQGDAAAKGSHAHTDPATGAPISNASWAAPLLAALSIFTSSPQSKAAEKEKEKGKEKEKSQEGTQGVKAGAEAQAGQQGQRAWWDFWSPKE